VTKRKFNYLNTYFYSVFSTNNTTLASVLPSYTSTHTLHNVEVNESEVLTILYSLDFNKAAGIDNIGPKVSIDIVLYHYLNQSATYLPIIDLSLPPT